MEQLADDTPANEDPWVAMHDEYQEREASQESVDCHTVHNSRTLKRVNSGIGTEIERLTKKLENEEQMDESGTTKKWKDLTAEEHCEGRKNDHKAMKEKCDAFRHTIAILVAKQQAVEVEKAELAKKKNVSEEVMRHTLFLYHIDVPV